MKVATGAHRDGYLFTTDTAQTADAVVGTCCGRRDSRRPASNAWSCVGLETTHSRSLKTICRAAPCLFGLLSVIAVLFRTLPLGK